MRYIHLVFLRAVPFIRMVKTLIYRICSVSDRGRWHKLENLKEGWDSRTKLIASMVPPDTSVLEFGAGRMTLPKYLHRSCRYTPSDIVDRGMGTIVCDLNKDGLPVFPFHDVVVFAGVLEYVHNVPQLLTILRDSCAGVIASYAVSEGVPENRRVFRRQQGWVNDYTSKMFVEMFKNAGFECDELREWKKQIVCKFSKK